MRVRRRDEGLAELLRQRHRAPIWIHESGVEMAIFDRVKAIDLSHDPATDGAAENIKRMRRDRENRVAARGPQSPDVVEVGQAIATLSD